MSLTESEKRHLAHDRNVMVPGMGFCVVRGINQAQNEALVEVVWPAGGRHPAGQLVTIDQGQIGAVIYGPPAVMAEREGYRGLQRQRWHNEDAN